MVLFSREDISWVLSFITKMLAFFAVLNAGIFPILLAFRISMDSYFLIFSYEGFCLLVLGGGLLFTSLSSTIEQDDYRHVVGVGYVRRGIRVRRLRIEDKRRMRQMGVIMIALGLPWTPVLLMWLVKTVRIF